MSRQYVILEADDVPSVDFGDVLETSADTLRWNNDRTKTFVKFTGSTPSWLEGKTTHTNAEILAILNDPDGEWYTDPEGT